MDYEKIAQVGLEIVKNASLVAKNAQVHFRLFLLISVNNP